MADTETAGDAIEPGDSVVILENGVDVDNNELNGCVDESSAQVGDEEPTEDQVTEIAEDTGLGPKGRGSLGTTMSGAISKDSLDDIADCAMDEENGDITAAEPEAAEETPAEEPVERKESVVVEAVEVVAEVVTVAEIAEGDGEPPQEEKPAEETTTEPVVEERPAEEPITVAEEEPAAAEEQAPPSEDVAAPAENASPEETIPPVEEVPPEEVVPPTEEAAPPAEELPEETPPPVEVPPPADEPATEEAPPPEEEAAPVPPVEDAPAEEPATETSPESEPVPEPTSLEPLETTPEQPPAEEAVEAPTVEEPPPDVGEIEIEATLVGEEEPLPEEAAPTDAPPEADAAEIAPMTEEPIPEPEIPADATEETSAVLDAESSKEMEAVATPVNESAPSGEETPAQVAYSSRRSSCVDLDIAPMPKKPPGSTPSSCTSRKSSTASRPGGSDGGKVSQAEQQQQAADVSEALMAQTDQIEIEAVEVVPKEATPPPPKEPTPPPPKEPTPPAPKEPTPPPPKEPTPPPPKEPTPPPPPPPKEPSPPPPKEPTPPPPKEPTPPPPKEPTPPPPKEPTPPPPKEPTPPPPKEPTPPPPKEPTPPPPKEPTPPPPKEPTPPPPKEPTPPPPKEPTPPPPKEPTPPPPKAPTPPPPKEPTPPPPKEPTPPPPKEPTPPPPKEPTPPPPKKLSQSSVPEPEPPVTRTSSAWQSTEPSRPLPSVREYSPPSDDVRETARSSRRNADLVAAPTESYIPRRVQSFAAGSGWASAAPSGKSAGFDLLRNVSHSFVPSMVSAGMPGGRSSYQPYVPRERSYYNYRANYASGLDRMGSRHSLTLFGTSSSPYFSQITTGPLASTYKRFDDAISSNRARSRQRRAEFERSRCSTRDELSRLTGTTNLTRGISVPPSMPASAFYPRPTSSARMLDYLSHKDAELKGNRVSYGTGSSVFGLDSYSDPYRGFSRIGHIGPTRSDFVSSVEQFSKRFTPPAFSAPVFYSRSPALSYKTSYSPPFSSAYSSSFAAYPVARSRSTRPPSHYSLMYTPSSTAAKHVNNGLCWTRSFIIVRTCDEISTLRLLTSSFGNSSLLQRNMSTMGSAGLGASLSSAHVMRSPPYACW